MLGRVTSGQALATNMQNMQSNLQRLADTQAKASSQRKNLSVSENPTDAQQTLAVHSEQARNTQYARNISDALAWTTTVDQTISSSLDMMQRARELVVQGANDGVMSDTAREAIATELDTIGKELFSLSNTEYLGRNVFAGTSANGFAFADDFTYPASADGGVTRRIGEGQSVRVDANGAEVFGEGADSVFATLQGIAADLRAGVNVGSKLADIDARMDSMSSVRGTVGAAQAQVERAQSATAAQKVDLEQRRSQVEDADTAEVLMQMQMQQLVYQSSLQVVARSIQPTLLDFIS